MNPDIPYLLVVEDEPTQRQILTVYLSRQGLRVAAVPDGRLMREALAAEMPQLILLDVGLPGEGVLHWHDGCANATRPWASSW